jgi:ATP-dependent RNA helicase SUPV3L1/SUV3
MAQPHHSEVKAILGPTNTGKTYYAVERLCAHSSGIIGFPLRLLAREVYDRVVAIKGQANVGLITGEERIMPPGARWILCTAESMPLDRDVAFVGLDEAQLGIDPDRGHVFTDRVLNVRGREETVILGSASLKPIVKSLLPEAEIISRPRFSNLSYSAPKKISRLPPRTAIIAFSADDVYAIAELVRRHNGGAAIVMGNLSPRTRNAQVAMYQAGEVDYIVATDAIGMGLNMDIGHVAFASLTKFDGARRRRLMLSEMAQIAGRAGRHQRDGTFGVAVTSNNPSEFSEIEIGRIEDHNFPPLSHLFWRNRDLDYSSPEALVDSLEMLPGHSALRSSPQAEDHTVLRNLMADEAVMALIRGSGMTKRLWDACGLPDFRSTGPDFHARLVSRLFTHLGTDNGCIPVQTIADEVARLDTVQGNIPALSSRLASIRTWTYIANRADWLDDPAHWVGRTREVEEKLSDALHRQLTERFVDRRTSLLLRQRGPQTSPRDFAVSEAGDVTLLDEPVGTLKGFRFAAAMDARSGERKKFLTAAEAALPAELGRRALALCASRDDAFTLHVGVGTKADVCWNGGVVATLKRGRALLKPEIELDASVARLEVPTREAIRARLAAFLGSYISQRLAPLLHITEAAFSPTTPPALRATLAPIAENGGIILRRAVDDRLQLINSHDRKTIRRLGVTIGSLSLFHPALLKPDAMRLRLILEAVRSGSPMPPIPMPGLGLLDQPTIDLAKAAAQAGFYTFGNQMLRFDLLERVALKIHDQRSGSAAFEPDTHLASSMGIGTQTLNRVMRELGFGPVGGSGSQSWRWIGLRRQNKPQRPYQSRPQGAKATA